MGSAIILGRRYWRVPSFEHYIRPAFNASDVTVDNLHGFNNGNEDQILLALRGDDIGTKIYKAIEASLSAMVEDERIHGNEWSSGARDIPEWREYSILVDKTPELIGIYNWDNTASELFPSVALGYIATASGAKIDKLIKDSGESLRSLGISLSGI